MKKVFLILLATFFTVGSYAQARKVRGNGNMVTKDKRVENFTQIIIHDGIDVNILNNPFQNKLSITGDANLHQIIETKVENGILTLKIKDDIEIINKTENFKISITTKDLTHITLKGNASLEGTGVNEIDKLTLTNEGSGNANLRVKTDELKAINKGSGSLTAEGNSNLIYVENSGSGHVQFDEVSTFFLEVHLSGSGNVHTNSVNGLDGTLTGSGNIYYKNTKTVNIENTGSGEVIRS